MTMPQQVTILGATGSIGESTLDVLSSHPDKFEVFALTANNNVDKLYQQILQFDPQLAVLKDEASAEQLRALLKPHSACRTQVESGEQAIIEVARAAETHTVVAAIVGAAGLQATLAAVQAGKRVLLANKEALVMAGGLFMATVAQNGAELLPVDSEHNAIFQCLPAGFSSLAEAGIDKIHLTGSGGPFLDVPLDSLAAVSPAQAIAHPNWSMGPKISVDSATMMNKGLEYIEACWLFGAKPDDIDIVIHPQSIIHSMVAYKDGSVLAQMGEPDMRTPISHCLGWPKRISNSVQPLNLFKMAELTFREPDYARFPCLRLAMDAMRSGGMAPAVLNAANEIAVQAFLDERIPYLAIAQVVDHVMQRANLCEPTELSVVVEADDLARSAAEAYINTKTTQHAVS